MPRQPRQVSLLRNIGTSLLSDQWRIVHWSMKKLFALVGSIAGAITGVIKAAGAITGNKWLGSNWQESLAYIGALLVVTYSLLALWIAITTPVEHYRHMHRAERLLPTPKALRKSVILRDQYAKHIHYVLVAVSLTALSLGLAAALVIWPVSLWPVGAFIILATVSFIGYVFIRGSRLWPSKKTCPFCREKVHVHATRCKHCHGEIPRRPRIILPRGYRSDR